MKLAASVLLAVATAIGLYVNRSRIKSLLGGPKSTPIPISDEKIPSVCPDPEPLYISTEDLKNYDTRPWRPFRWPYFQTMSTFKLDINHWLDMDKYYDYYMKEKSRIRNQYGKEHFDWLPEAEDACFELMEVTANHMLKRYPLLFTQLPSETGVIIKNEINGDIIDMSLPLKEPPLWYVSRLAKEDIYLVQKRDDGLHYLVGVAVAFPGGHFGIKVNMGQHLDTIHTNVPYYEEGLKKSMERWFKRFEPGSPVERASWHIVWDHKLKFNDIMRLKHDERVPTEIPPEDFNIRIERQALRKLPRTGAVIFSAYPLFYSIEEMKDEPLIPSLLKKIMYEAPEKIIEYRHFMSIRDHLSPYLDKLIQRQIDKGLITEDTPIRTLPSYPFAYYVKNSDHDKGWNNPNVPGGKGENFLNQLWKDVPKEGD